jgi:TonB family protein
LWLLGIAGCAALFVRQQRHFVRALGNLSATGDRACRAQATAGCPALVGAWRPRIVLPADFEQRYDRAQRELVLAHERAHMSRCDAQFNALAAALRCLYWFNPLFHFAASRQRFDQELACDASVMSRFPESRRSYADAMLKTQLADLGLPAGCHWQSSHPLKERIAMLKQPLPGRLRRRLGGACVAALIVAASFAAWAARPAQASIADAAAPVSMRIRADIVLNVDDAPLDSSWRSQTMTGYSMRHDPKKAPSDWEMGLIAGHPFSLEIDNQGESWKIDGTVQLSSDGAIELTSTLAHDGSVVSHPRLIMRDGEQSGIKVGEEKDGKFKGFAAQFTLHETKPMGRVEKAQAKSESALPASGASYRRISRIDYPASAIAAKLDGIVYVRVNVSADGRVADAKADSVHPMSATQLADAAVAAVKKWTFNPSLHDGKPVASVEVIPIAFTLDPKSELHLEGGTLDAIRVSLPLAEAATPAESVPASENVEYRRMHPPHYPASAIKAHEQGEVTIKVLVDASGNPLEARVAKTDPPDMSSDLTNSAIAAVLQWKFNPSREHGKPVEGWALVPITFSLTEK